MSRWIRSRATGTLVLGILVAGLAAGFAPVAGHSAAPSSGPSLAPATADLAPSLSADGTFHGSAGISGTVDASAWTLVTDPSTGQPPRFARAGSPAARAGSPATTPTGPWSALGTDGNFNGPVDRTVNALAVSGSNLYVGGGFRDAGGVAKADYVAKWNGHAWSARVRTATAMERSTTTWRPSRFPAPTSTSAVTSPTPAASPRPITSPSGTATPWSALGSDGHGDGAITYNVVAIAVSGATVYAGGYFTPCGGHRRRRLRGQLDRHEVMPPWAAPPSRRWLPMSMHWRWWAQMST